ncbi:hypothetical protein E4U52_003360 [Claviceps spartinae]|nr:hypothetical protein E4U52_003360 [Claviceps spartinae]
MPYYASPRRMTIDGQNNSKSVFEPAHFLTRMKVTIKEWNTVATWRWDIPEDDVCGICQVHFDGTCPTCKYPGDDCSLLSGKCGHNFHMHCIMEWIKQEAARGQCPMCRQSRWTLDWLLMTSVADELAAFEWVDQANEGTLPVE